MPNPAKLKVTPKKTSRSSGAKPQVDRRAKHDWSAIRRAYIRGDETVTYASLAATPGYPNKRQIEKRASADGWVELRRDLERQVDGRLRQLDLDMKTEVRRRHAEVGKDFLAMAAAGLRCRAPEELEPVDVARYAKIGAELERRALGMEEINVNLGRIRSPDDLDKLGEAELWRLAGMLPPEDDDDPAL
jgi:hypothetical protein